MVEAGASIDSTLSKKWIKSNDIQFKSSKGMLLLEGSEARYDDYRVYLLVNN